MVGLEAVLYWGRFWRYRNSVIICIHDNSTILDKMKTKRKKLSITKRLVILDLDKCKRCNGKLRQRRVYPFPIACSDCNEDIIYEDEVKRFHS